MSNHWCQDLQLKDISNIKGGDDINIKYTRGDNIHIKYKRADNLYFIQIITVYNVYQICNKIITDFISGFLNALFIVCLHC
jgi:hypothetical protein